MDIIRIATAGSVDDGKSTLIGRLLYETRSLKQDQLDYIRAVSHRRGSNTLDLSLATDGLSSEREQGITIDVSHIYLTTKTRRYIITDSPGHEEYTRNMITASSKADVILILLDATKGLSQQTRRHLRIAHTLQIPELIICINKMDLISYSKLAFDELVLSFKEVNQYFQSTPTRIHFLPISALTGDNISSRSDHMHWFEGSPLLQTLESIQIPLHRFEEPFFQVQYVWNGKAGKQKTNKRWLFGKLNNGTLFVGDEVYIRQGQARTRIAKILQYGNSLPSLSQNENGTLLLEDEIDVSRGIWIYKKEIEYTPVEEVLTETCWMDSTPLNPGKKYWIQMGSKSLMGKVKEIKYKIDLYSTQQLPAESVGLNDLAVVTWTLSEPVHVRPYQRKRSGSEFIVIDPLTLNTSGVSLIQKQK
ncbi:MAG TPA: GTP-binding protein [Saprospiraceae bacterium]|nr:GTP-binding protein [Saprospiraceae bacterium]